MSEPPAVSALRERIWDYLRESVAGVSVDEMGDFVVSYQGTVTFIRPVTWRKERTLVRVWSITNVGVDADEDLPEYLLTANARVVFGGFRLDPFPPAVLLTHTLLGDYLNRAELLTATAAVATTAEAYAPEIRARFGGRLFTDP